MKCPKCGFEVGNKYKFCPYCGEDLSNNKEEVED